MRNKAGNNQGGPKRVSAKRPTPPRVASRLEGVMKNIGTKAKRKPLKVLPESKM